MTYKLPTLEETIEEFEELGKKEEGNAYIVRYLDPKSHYAYKCSAAKNRQIARWLKQLLDFRRIASDGEIEDGLLRRLVVEDRQCDT